MNSENNVKHDKNLLYYKSLKKYEESLEQFSSMKSGLLAARSLVKIGDIYKDMANFEKSIESYKLALELYDDENNLQGVATTLKSIGCVWKSDKEFVEARKYFEKSLNTFRLTGNPEMEKDVSELISKCYQEEGSLKNAINIHLNINQNVLNPKEKIFNKLEINRLINAKNNVKPTKIQLLVIISYILALTVTEIVNFYNILSWSILLEVIITISLVISSVIIKDLKLSYLLQALILLPLVRIICFSIPVFGIQPLYWMIILTFPVLVAIMILMRNQHIHWYDVGLNNEKLPYQLLIGLSGIGLGLVEYLILQPKPLIPDFNLVNLIIGGIVLILATGFVEEVIFRGMIQRTAENVLGGIIGIIFASILFTSFNLSWKSPLNLIFIFIVSIFYGYVYQKTRSIIGVSISHGLCNLLLYIYLPFIL